MALPSSTAEVYRNQQQGQHLTSTPNIAFNRAHISAMHDTPPFQDVETFHEIRDQDGLLVRPEIHCNILKGFFLSTDGTWTCYRRNYLSVSCSYSLTPLANSKCLFLLLPDTRLQIQSIAMSLSADIVGTDGKSVTLVQHTPKRDKGPQTNIQFIKLRPTPKETDSLERLSSYNPS